MNFVKKKSKSSWLLLLILGAGLALRATNSTFGLPSLYVSNDEAIAHLSALNMLAAKTPISIANYTPLGAYVQIPFLVASFAAMKLLGLVKNVSDFELFLLTHEGYFLFIPRLISALFGTLTILVLYKISLFLFKNREVALISAFLCAVSFNLVHISHFGRPWAAALFFFLLAIYLAIRTKYTHSYLAVAISFGFHQVGILAAPLVFWLTKRRLSFGNLVNIIVLSLLFVIFSSLTLKTGLIESIRRDQSFLKEGKFAADFLIGSPDLIGSAIRSFWGNLSVYFVVNWLVTDGILLIFGVWGITKNFEIKNSKRKIIYYILLYFILASLFFHPLIRYLLHIILLTIPFAAWAINSIFMEKRYLIVPVLILTSVNSLWWNSLFIREPTFIRASEWIGQNVSADVPIAYVGNRYQTFVPNKEAILHVQEVNRSFHNRLASILPSNDFDNVRNIVYVSNFDGNNKLDQLNNASDNYRMAYVVDYYIDPRDRLYDLDPKGFEIMAQFKPTRSGEVVAIAEPLFDASWNFPTNNFRAKLSMYELDNTGPFVDILKVKSH